jgi:tripartite-type tricarboxylate transporter receptor subunit TctC
MIGERMRVLLRQTIVIENVTGANGTIGVGRLARATGDGYTIAMGSWNTFVANGAIYALPYNLLNDFVPVAGIATQPLLIVARRTMPANDLTSFIAWLRDNPDKAAAGTSGLGSTQHVVGIYFQQKTNTKFAFVPYRGGAQAVQDVIAGQLDFMLATAADCVEQVRAGRIKAFAVTADRQLGGAPGIPNVDEAGLPGFYFSQWSASFAPKGTPQQVIAKLSAAIMDALADPAVRNRFGDLGQEIFPRDQQTPEALHALQKADIEKWWPIIKAANIKAQ